MAKRNKSPQRSAMQEVRDRANERLGQWVRKKWRIESLLGVGGMASVYAATHRNGAQVALKILHTEFATDDNVKQRFLREGYVANKVSHPGVVSILDDDQTDDGAPFLVMELLLGETLQQLWKRHNRHVPPAEALRISGAILDTLVPFHQQNIIHRDLKPANIFITKEDHVKLLDFGVAQLRESGQAMTRAGTALGTPSYMSPEQAMGKSDTLDGRSDLFAVGATLFAILSGKRLHHGRSDNEAFILAATQPAPSLARRAPELPVEVIALVDKALQWDRRKRFDDAAQMRDACQRVESALRGERTSVAAEASPPPGAIPARASETPNPAAHSTVPPAYGSSPSRPPSVHPSAEQRVSETPSVDGIERPPAGRISSDNAKPPESMQLIFERLERSLPTLRQYGFEHPEGVARIRGVYRAVVDALREMQDGYCWSVYPYCLTFGNLPLWEPAPPNDRIPYLLAAAGVEEVAIMPGVRFEELETFLRIAVSESSSLLDGDVAAALWEARLKNVRITIRDDFADADAAAQAKFYAEADDLEAIAQGDLAEVAAMAVTTEAATSQQAQQAADSLALEPAARAALQTQVSADISRWRSRHIAVLLHAIADAKSRDDAELVLKPLSRAVYRLGIRERHDEMFATHRALMSGLAARSDNRFDGTAVMLTGWMFPPRLVQLLTQRLATSNGADPASDTLLSEGLNRVFAALPAESAPELLSHADNLPAGPVQEQLLTFVERSLDGNEEAIVGLLDGLSAGIAQRTLAALATLSGDGQTAMLRPLLMSPNRALRCEAMALLSQSRDELGKQLLRMLESTDNALRAASLTTMVRHKVRSAGPGLVGLIERDGFGKRPADEQERMFETLFELNAARAQVVLGNIVLKHGLMADESLDTSRLAAVNLLGKHATNADPLAALEQATRRRPWNTPALRAAADLARNQIRKRLQDKAQRRAEERQQEAEV